MEMKKKLEWLDNVGTSLGKVLLGTFILLLVFVVITVILNIPRFVQEYQNYVWLKLEQPSEDKVINELYDFYLPDQLTFEEKVQFTNESGSYPMKDYLVIYLSQPENFKLVLEGKIDREEMLVEIDYSKRWMETVSLDILRIFLILLLLFITIWIVFWTMYFIDKIREKREKSKEPKERN
jgi:hypothetical protein